METNYILTICLVAFSVISGIFTENHKGKAGLVTLVLSVVSAVSTLLILMQKADVWFWPMVFMAATYLFGMWAASTWNTFSQKERGVQGEKS